MYWYPQALFTAEQACRRRFLFVWKTTRLFAKVTVLVIICQYLTMCRVCLDTPMWHGVLIAIP